MPDVVLELAGYAGAAAALASVGVIVDSSSGAGVQVAVGFITTAALIAVGVMLMARADPVHRMRSVFWFIAILSWTNVAGVLVGQDVLGLQDRWVAVVGAAIVAALAVPLWFREQRSLQLIAAFISCTVAVAALVFSTREESFFGFTQEVPTLRWSALVTVVFGVAGMVLGAREVVRPQRTAMVLGSLAFLFGLPFLFMDPFDVMTGGAGKLPLWVTLAGSGVVLLVGSRVRIVAVSGIGIVGLVLAVSALVDAYVFEQAPAIGVLVLGLALLAATVALTRMDRAAAPVGQVVPPSFPPEVPAPPPPPGDAP
jgi:hypothetical protein